MSKSKGKRVKEKPKKRKHRGLKVFSIIVIILIAAILSAYFFAIGKLDLMDHQEINKENLAINNSTNEKLKGYRNIAIFGIDSRAEDDYGEGNRSDCIIIASINQDTNEVKLVSVYRDTYVQIEGYGLDKITHAYSYGGPELALNTINANLDLNIDEFVAVNWKAVADAVDLLGGITIDIDSSEIYQMNKYVYETAKSVGKTAKRVTKAGEQTLNGVQAVTYARIRKTSGGDYKRAERMRTVVEEMVKEAKTKNLSELNEIANEILPEISTNINANEILSLIPTALSFNISDSMGWPYETKGFSNSGWYGVPVTLKSNVEKLHEELFNQEDYEPSETLEEISRKIINRTGYTIDTSAVTNTTIY